jgi:transcriptional antiterminator RfaH
VRFGLEPARIDDALVAYLRQQQDRAAVIKRLFEPGQRVLVTEGAFAGVEGVFQMDDGQARAMVLIELLSRQVRLPVAAAQLRALP